MISTPSAREQVSSSKRAIATLVAKANGESFQRCPTSQVPKRRGAESPAQEGEEAAEEEEEDEEDEEEGEAAEMSTFSCHS